MNKISQALKIYIIVSRNHKGTMEMNLLLLTQIAAEDLLPQTVWNSCLVWLVKRGRPYLGCLLNKWAVLSVQSLSLPLIVVSSTNDHFYAIVVIITMILPIISHSWHQNLLFFFGSRLRAAWPCLQQSNCQVLTVRWPGDSPNSLLLSQHFPKGLVDFR